jgi:hypothetical protein
MIFSRVEMEGIFGVASNVCHWLGFSARAVEFDKPFLSETGYRSFVAVGGAPEAGFTPDRFAREVISAHVQQSLTGRLVAIKPECREQGAASRAQALLGRPSIGGHPGKASERMIVLHRRRQRGVQWRRNEKLPRYGQSAALVGFERDLLREHHIARHEIAFRNETPARAWPAIPIELDNVRADAMLDAIGLTAIATNDLKIIVVVKLFPLLRR